jgi:hypothetical protein
MEKIEEKAFFVQSEKEVGITNNVIDIAKMLEELEPGEVVKVGVGYKQELLNIENTVLRLDAVLNAYGEEGVFFPKRVVDYNLVERNRDPEKLRKFYNFVGSEQDVEQSGIFGSLIEGGDKHVK